MRLRICLVPADGRDKAVIPFDFRRHFISLLKQLFEGSGVAERFALERPGFSPYVFGVGFRRVVGWKSEEQLLEVVPPVQMVISTGIPPVLTAAANGALRLYDRPAVLGLKVASLSVMPLRRLREETAVFRIAGHAVLRGKDGYLDPSASSPEEIAEAINTHMFKRLEFLSPDYLPPGRISPVSVVPELSSLRKGVCAHYGGMITAVQGRIALKGSPASLQFLYDFGIGVRTGQGFGMLERV
ncbi:MAG: CRISPR-associated endoribonuclease Cas6 [Thermacetogeniaceae bacterium]